MNPLRLFFSPHRRVNIQQTQNHFAPAKTDLNQPPLANNFIACDERRSTGSADNPARRNKNLVRHFRRTSISIKLVTVSANFFLGKCHFHSRTIAA